MRPTLALAALDALALPHRYGHRCTNNDWYSEGTGTRTPCPVMGHVNTAREQVARLAAQVHDAAHDTPTMVAVMEGMTGFDAEELADEDRDAWVRTARLAVETLAHQLDRDPAVEARIAAIEERLAVVGEVLAYGLNPEEMEALTLYNAERFRGFMHTPEYDTQMAGLQARFNIGIGSR